MKIDEKKILEEIKKLERKQYRVKSTSDYLFTQIDLETQATIYKNLTGEDVVSDYFRNPFYEERLRGNHILRSAITLFDYFSTQEECTEIAKHMLKSYKNSQYIDYWMDDSQRTLSKKDFLEIIKGFLSSHDERLYKSLNDCLSENLLNLDTEKIGTCATFPKYSDSGHIILVDIKRNIPGLRTLAHELGHFYTFKELSRRSRKQLYYFTISFYEMYSTFLELAFMDYLKKNHILMKDTMICENEFYASILDQIAGLMDCADFSEDENEWDILQYIINSYIYSYGFKIALHLHERYLSEPKDVQKRIDEFVFSQGLLPKAEQLKVLGITVDDLKDEKILTKRLQTHNENMKKYVVR